MKRYSLWLVLIVGLVAPLGAMEPSKQEDGFTECIEQYMNTTVSAVLFRLGALFADKNLDKTARARKVVKEVLDALAIGEFPLKVKNIPDAKVKNFFSEDKLKELFEKLWEHYEESKIGPKKFHKYIELFRKSLDFQKIENRFGPQESLDLRKFLNAAEKYYRENDEGADIDNFIDFDNLPEFLDTILKDYVCLDKLKVLLNSQLNKKVLTKELMLDCLNFTPLVKEIGCDKQDYIMMDQGIRGGVALLIELTEKPKDALKKLMRYIGTGYSIDRVAHVVVPVAK